MRPVLVLVLAVMAGCGSSQKGKPPEPPRSRSGPAVMPHEAPERRVADFAVRTSGEIHGKKKTSNEGGRFEAAAEVGVTHHLSVGIVHTVRVEEKEFDNKRDIVGGFDDLRVSAGWHHALRAGMPIRLFAEAWLPTRADVFDEDRSDKRGRISLAIARDFDKSWLWMVPTMEASLDRRNFEGGLEVGAAAHACGRLLLAVRGGAFQRYTNPTDRLVGFGRGQIVFRGPSGYLAMEVEGGFRPQGYGQFTLAFGLRTKLW